MLSGYAMNFEIRLASIKVIKCMPVDIAIMLIIGLQFHFKATEITKALGYIGWRANAVNAWLRVVRSACGLSTSRPLDIKYI